METVVIIRPSFKKICGPDSCRAGLFNHLLFRLAGKAKGEQEEKISNGEMYWFASAEEVCQDMNDDWSVNKIRKEIDALVDAGLLGQRHNPAKGWDRKYQYFVGKEQGAKIKERCEAEGICLHQIGLSDEVLHLLYLVNACPKKGKCKCQKCEMELPNKGNASTKYGRAIPKTSYKTSTKDTNQDSSSDVPETGKPPEKPVCPPKDAKWGTRTCLLLFDFWRGAPLLVQHEITKASQAAKALSERYTREQVELVRDHMLKKAEWWKDHPDAVDVVTVARHIHKFISKVQVAPNVTPFPGPRLTDEEYYEALRQKDREGRAHEQQLANAR